MNNFSVKLDYSFHIPYDFTQRDMYELEQGIGDLEHLKFLQEQYRRRYYNINSGVIIKPCPDYYERALRKRRYQKPPERTKKEKEQLRLLLGDVISKLEGKKEGKTEENKEK